MKSIILTMGYILSLAGLPALSHAGEYGQGESLRRDEQAALLGTRELVFAELRRNLGAPPALSTVGTFARFGVRDSARRELAVDYRGPDFRPEESGGPFIVRAR